MEPQKRKYQKHKTEKLITVIHFLNTRLKGKKQDNGQNAYPVYISITVKNQHTDIKSRLTDFSTIEGFDSFKEKNASLLKQEVDIITSIIKELKPFERQSFALQQAVTTYGLYIKPLISVIEEKLKIAIQYCIVQNSSDQQTDADLTEKTNFYLKAQENALIQLINWQLPAEHIISSLQEIITDPNFSSALSELEKTYHQAFNFRSVYNTLNSVYRYSTPPTLTDWHNGTIQADLKKYFTNSLPTIETINLLLENHLY